MLTIRNTWVLSHNSWNIVFGMYAFSNREVEFSFNNFMYAQIGGVSMGSPFGPMLANIFVGFQENLLFERHWKPHVYLWNVDDTFSVFDSSEDAEVFHVQLSSLHPSSPFIVEVVSNIALPFLDVLAEGKEGSFIIGVYRKSTSTGLYTNWNSFVPKPRKISLFSNLVHRALMICSPDKFDKETENIYSIFNDNGMPSSARLNVKLNSSKLR